MLKLQYKGILRGCDDCCKPEVRRVEVGSLTFPQNMRWIMLESKLEAVFEPVMSVCYWKLIRSKLPANACVRVFMTESPVSPQ